MISQVQKASFMSLKFIKEIDSEVELQQELRPHLTRLPFEKISVNSVTSCHYIQVCYNLQYIQDSENVTLHQCLLHYFQVCYIK